MIFLSYWFVCFAAVFFPLYWLARDRRVRLALLLAACVVFHGHFAGPAGVIPIAVLAVVTYLIGLSRRGPLCVAGIVLSVAALLVYKYSGFIATELVGAASPEWGRHAKSFADAWLPAAPPLAISFFAFEFIHYLYDVRKGAAPLRNPAQFANFAIFWPSIVAGPVKRFEQFVPAAQDGAQNVSPTDVAYGAARVAAGFVKKAAADNLTAYVTFFDDRFGTLPLADRWCIFAAITFRILLDFSGYSDMAIGFARMTGIRLPENFNWPYLATSVTDFWRRWHISLSTWIRDYVYVPLGGGRRGLVRKAVNGLLAFAVVGLWHGAAWNFILWGLYHGLGLAVASNYRKTLGPVGHWIGWSLDRNAVVAWAITMAWVSAGWLLFFYPAPRAWEMLKMLFSFA